MSSGDRAGNYLSTGAGEIPPLSLLVESNYSVCSGVEEWMAEVKGRVDSCGLESD